MTPIILKPNQPELFLDTSLVAKLEGAVALHDHQPVEREVVMTHEEPWEGPTTTYHTILKDGDRYRMYYRGSTVNPKRNDPIAPADHPPYACYAESSDGIVWQKPELGLFEHAGSKANNIVFNDPIICKNFSPFIDTNPDAPASARFRAVGEYNYPEKHHRALQLLESADGIHWQLSRPEPIIEDGYFDSLNKIFWDQSIGRYRAYYRDFQFCLGEPGKGTEGGLRAIKTAASPDLINWTRGEYITFPAGGPDMELYTNAVMPYYRSPRYYLSFPMRYTRMRDALGKKGPCEALMMSSTDGFHFNRRNEALIRPGLSSSRWLNRNNLPANAIVETASSEPDRPPELSIYATEGYSAGPGSRLRRYTFRLDGFVSAKAKFDGGFMTTAPLVAEASQHPLTLSLNVSTAAAGFVKVAILKADGRELEGFGLADSNPIRGDKVNWLPTWGSDNRPHELSQNPFHLHFQMADADLFAIEAVPSRQ